jgi:hypothetical protein
VAGGSPREAAGDLGVAVVRAVAVVLVWQEAVEEVVVAVVEEVVVVVEGEEVEDAVAVAPKRWHEELSMIPWFLLFYAGMYDPSIHIPLPRRRLPHLPVMKQRREV